MAIIYFQPYDKHHYATGYIASTFEENAGTFNMSTTTATGKTKTQGGDVTLESNYTRNASTYTVGNQKLRRKFSSESKNQYNFRSADDNRARTNANGGSTSSTSDGGWSSGSGTQKGTASNIDRYTNSRTNEDASTSSGLTNDGGGGLTIAKSSKALYDGTTEVYGYTSTQTSSASVGKKIKIYDPDSQLVNRNQTTKYKKTIVTKITEEAVRGNKSIVANSTVSRYTRGGRSTGGSPGSIYPPDNTNLDSDDPNNGAGTPTSRAYNKPKIYHQSSLANTTYENYDVYYTDTETTSTNFRYTLSTLSASKNTTTSSTSIRTTKTKSPDWTHPYEPFRITQTIDTYVTESVETDTYNATKKISIVTGAAYMTGGDVLENGLVAGNIQTVTSVLIPIENVDFVEYTSDAQSGGGVQNATRMTKSTYVTDFQILKFTNSEINAESYKLANLAGKSFAFGNAIDYINKGDTVTRQQGYSTEQANDDTRRKKYIYEQENVLGAFNVSSSGSHTVLTTYYRSYLNSDQKLSFSQDTDATARSFGVFQSYRMQNTYRDSDDNTLVYSRGTTDSKTTKSAMTIKEPVKSDTPQSYSDYGRKIRPTANAGMSGDVYTADKNFLYGGYQYKYESIVSKAARKYRDISIGDQVIKTTQITNSNAASIPLTVNSAVSNTYISSFNFPLFSYSNPLRLNPYFTFIPEGSYGNIYTSVTNGSASFEYLENDQSHIIYQYSKTYTTEVSANDSRVAAISTDMSVMDGLVKVNIGANYGDGAKTAFSKQGGMGYLQGHQQCFGGKTFTNEKGFSFANGNPINSYVFDSDDGSTLMASSSGSISTAGNATVSLPAEDLIFAFLPEGVATARNNTPYYRKCADFRSTRD